MWYAKSARISRMRADFKNLQGRSSFFIEGPDIGAYKRVAPSLVRGLRATGDVWTTDVTSSISSLYTSLPCRTSAGGAIAPQSGVLRL